MLPGNYLSVAPINTEGVESVHCLRGGSLTSGKARWVEEEPCRPDIGSNSLRRPRRTRRSVDGFIPSRPLALALVPRAQVLPSHGNFEADELIRFVWYDGDSW